VALAAARGGGSGVAGVSDRLGAAAAVLLASKLEDVEYIAVEDLVLCLGGSVSNTEVVAAEEALLTALGFQLALPTALDALGALAQCLSPPPPTPPLHGSDLLGPMPGPGRACLARPLAEYLLEGFLVSGDLGGGDCRDRRSGGSGVGVGTAAAMVLAAACLVYASLAAGLPPASAAAVAAAAAEGLSEPGEKTPDEVSGEGGRVSCFLSPAAFRALLERALAAAHALHRALYFATGPHGVVKRRHARHDDPQRRSATRVEPVRDLALPW